MGIESRDRDMGMGICGDKGRGKGKGSGIRLIPHIRRRGWRASMHQDLDLVRRLDRGRDRVWMGMVGMGEAVWRYDQEKTMGSGKYFL